MNDHTTTRRIRDGESSPEPQKDEAVVLREVLQAMRSLDFGSVQLTVQDSRVVQIEVTRKRRL